MIISNMTPVNEAYFGKSKELIEIESLIKTIVNRLKTDPKNYGKRFVEVASTINKCPENIKIQELFKKQFGFKHMYLHWDGNPDVNAYTGARGIIKMVSGGMNKLPVRSADGKYYDESHSYLCFVNVYAGCVDIGCTAEEILGAIMHEIGHNFQCTPITNFATIYPLLVLPIYASWTYNCIKARNYFWSIMNSLALYASVRDFIINQKCTEYLKQVHDDMDKWIVSHKDKAKKEVDEYQKQKEEADKVNYNDCRLYTPLILAMLLGWETFIYGPVAIGLSTLEQQLGYSGEVYADSFATAYGYGPALSSFCHRCEKMNLDNPYLNKKSEHLVFNQCSMIMLYGYITLMDPHPANQTRIRNQINKLESELKKEDYPPELKQALQEDLAKTRKVYNRFMEMEPQHRHLTIMMMLYNVNENWFKGKLEFRDIINRIANLTLAEA